MTPGAIVRSLLGSRVLPRVLEIYRAVFVDLDKLVACIPVLPAGIEVLDVGGGDGAVLDRLLRRQTSVRASLIDPSPSVGMALSPGHLDRVRLYPMTSVRDCATRRVPLPEVVLLTDVLHHVRRQEREELLREIRKFCGDRLQLLVVKDVAPNGWRARLGLLSDRYVTGDRHVTLTAPEEMRQLVAGVFPDLVCRATTLYEQDSPNYCWLFERPDAPGHDRVV